MKSLAALAATLLVLVSPAFGSTTEFFVAPDGDGAGSGTRSAPFGSVAAARDAIRRLQKTTGLPERGVTVWIGGGIYRFTESLHLTAEDSGAEQASVVYRACAGEHVFLTGGLELPAVEFDRVVDPSVLERIVNDEAREHMRRIDLRAMNVTSFDAISPRGFSRPIRPAPLELFIDGKPMTLARWPNDGFVKTGNVLDPGSRSRQDDETERQPVFTYDDERPNRWSHADDIWLFGYWFHDWADEAIRVQSIDVENRRITLASPHTYGVAEGKPYYAENLLEELDRPGEYYVDRTTGVLYVWPPAPLGESTIAVSTLAGPLIQLQDVSYVTFRGLTLEVSRGDGIVIRGGAGVRVTGCRLRDLGNRAVVIEGGTNHGVVSCDVYETGEGGIMLTGGDRKSLTPAGHFAENNHIHHYSRRSATYRGAVHLNGVGNRASHNLIHDAPHTAIFFWGNDHVIEFNEIHDVLRRTGDGGAVYTGRDWTFRGNVIRYNFFHDINGIHKWENAVYIDDQASGTTIFGNVFQNCHWGMLIGGGRDNVIENNVFSNCRLAIHLDARGLGWAEKALGGILPERLAAVPYRAEPWASRYPKLVGILDDDPMAPNGNAIRCNVLYRSGAIDADINTVARQNGIIEQNWETDEEPLLTDVQGPRIAVRTQSAVCAQFLGFAPIPCERIGLYVDECRTALPLQDSD